MFEASKIQSLLMEELANAQAKNPRYSMRAYAKKVGVSQAAISQILSGKRAISKKSARRILSGLDRNPSEIERLLGGTAPEFKSLDADSFHLIADWHYFAILSLAETRGFRSSPEWIASRLGISKKIAEGAIERLVRIGLLESDPKNGKLRATGDQFAAISSVATPALRKANRQNLELAERALEEIPLEARDFTAITICFDPAKIEEARNRIREFRRNFADAMESGAKKEVYKICIQLFPLTRSSP